MASGAAPAGSADTPAKPGQLRIAYSDWPGWVAWEIAIQKGWFKEAGVDVDFKWFEYAPSMEAFSAGKVDAVTMTNGDALVTGSSGGKSTCIVANDYSDGNDMIVAKPGIKKMEQLKGKKIGVEVGFVDHLLLMNALKAAHMTDKDVQIVNVPTDQTPQSLEIRHGGRDRRVAAEQRQRIEGAAGLDGDLHERQRSGPDLRPFVREPAQPGRAQGGLGEGREDLVPRDRLHRRPEELG